MPIWLTLYIIFYAGVSLFAIWDTWKSHPRWVSAFEILAPLIAVPGMVFYGQPSPSEAVISLWKWLFPLMMLCEVVTGYADWGELQRDMNEDPESAWCYRLGLGLAVALVLPAYWMNLQLALL